MMKLNLKSKTLSIVSIILILHVTAAAVLPIHNSESEAGFVSKSTRTIYDKYPDIKQIETWEYATVAVESGLNGDKLWAWGTNINGVMTSANGLEENGIYSPTNITPKEWEGKDIKDIAISNNSGAAIISSNDSEGNEVDELYTWGNNTYGLLGNGTASNEVIMTPTLVTYSGTEDWILNEVETSTSTMLITATDNTDVEHIYTWGKNSSGALGVGTGSSSLSYSATPTEVTFADNDGTWKTKKVEGSTWDSFVVSFETSTNDVAYAWGHNSNYALGIDANGGEHATPVLIKNFNSTTVDYEIKTIKDFDLGIRNVAAVVNDGTNDHIIISGMNKAVESKSSFTNIYSTTLPEQEIKSIEVGYDYLHAIYNDGSVDKVYGIGNDTELKNIGYDYEGNGFDLSSTFFIANYYHDEFVEATLPEGFQIMSMTTVYNHTFILGKDGVLTKVFAIGSDDENILGIPKRSSTVTTAAAVDFTYVMNVEEVENGFGLVNLITMIIMIIIWVLLIGAIILFVLHKIHHKKHIESIEEHGRTLTGENDEK